MIDALSAVALIIGWAVLALATACFIGWVVATLYYLLVLED